MPGISFLSNPQKYVETEFKKIVSASNIRRMIFFDKNGTETKLKDRSGNAKDVTLSYAANSLKPANSGKARTLNFSSTSYYWDFEDSDDLSFGDGSTDSAFSIISCIMPNASNNQYPILRKADSTTGNTKNEWALSITNNSLYAQKFDNSTGANIGRRATNKVTSDIGVWHTYIATYEATASSSGISIYRDAVKTDDANSESGSYTAMENLGAKAGNYLIGTGGTITNVGLHRAAFIAIVAESLTQTKVTSIDTLLRKYVGVI